MTLSQTGLQAALGPSTDQIFLECLTIEHASISDILVVNDKQDLTRTAGTFIAFPFRTRLHARSDDRVAEAEIVADNVDQRLILNLRGLPRGTTITYEVVLRGSPNTIEQGPMAFSLESMVADIATVALRVSFDLAFLNEAFPAGYFAPWNAS